jgi:RNA polymerase sigma-70 factor, ECF subfamily
MEVQGRSSLMPRDAVARLGPPRDQTAMAFSSVATPASVEDTCRCLGSAHPTLNEVLARYQDAIYRYAIHLTGNRGDADAVYQETALKAYYEFDRLNGEVNHRAWLYGIATNAFLRDLRQRSKEGSLDEQSADLVFAAAGAARSASCSLVQEVRAAMERLPLQQRIALIQRTYHDLSYAEIAASLGCSEATARTSVYQALRTLGNIFGEQL